MDSFIYFIEHTEDGLNLILGAISFSLLIIVPLAIIIGIMYILIKSGIKNHKEFNKMFDNEEEKQN